MDDEVTPGASSMEFWQASNRRTEDNQRLGVPGHSTY